MTKKCTLAKFSTRLAFILCWCLLQSAAFAQPTNDNCASASTITISNGGFGLGSFIGTQFDLTNATIQTGETFAPSITVSGLTKKSVWYKFTLPTTRVIKVSLAQPGNAIQAGNVGFTVYKTNQCLPINDSISTKLSPIATFGSSYHPCVQPGDYVVQVTSNSTANGPIFVTVDISDTTHAAYDKPATAYKFGKLTNKISSIDFAVDCQSIDDASEVCLPNTSFKDFTKSTWHTFTTPAYFDYLAVLLAESSSSNTLPDYTIGYRIYEGDATTTALGSLIQIGGCDSIRTNGYYPGKKIYRCGELKTNTTYTVQLLYHKDLTKTMRLAVAWDGTAATTGPLPINTLPTPNKMGILKASAGGTLNTALDNLGCNSRHSQSSCPKSMPVNGLKFTNNYIYNLSSFFSFTLSSPSVLAFTATSDYCSNGLFLLRLYKQDLTANCSDLDTSNLLNVFVYNQTINCLPAGNYVLQVMGVDSLMPKNNITYGNLYNNTAPLCLYYNFGRNINLSINAKTLYPANKFSLSAPGAFDKINPNAGGTMQPLLIGKSYVAAADTFGCANTVLPADKLCGVDTTKAVFREFVVNDSVMVNITSSYYYKIYSGDADALAQAQNKYTWPARINGLAPVTPCVYPYSCDNYRNGCITPGTYTEAIFGDETQLGVAINSTIVVSKPVTKHFTPITAQDMGSLWDSATKYNTLTFGSDADVFSCRDNAATIGGFDPCTINGQKATKLIYRQFYLNAPALVTITSYANIYGGCSYAGTMTLFTGKATDGLTDLKPVGAPWSCFTSASISNQCTPLPAGWYTVVSYGEGPSFSSPLQGWADQGFNYLGLTNQFNIYLTKACAAPQFNRPFKASVDTTTKNPYKIVYGAQTGSTVAYPITGKTYTLNKENFNCTVDTPFSSHPIASCGTNTNKVAYYVFTTSQEAYLRIYTGSGAIWGSVYAFDVRKDSLRFKNATDTALQPCLNSEGRIELCRLQPGTYTLVIFAPSTFTCNSTTPSIYIDSVGSSRFDHATNAYDFGDIKPDSIWYNGKRGDVNPLNTGRAPSNDFFFCTTGAKTNDPTSGLNCNMQYNPLIYPSKTNNVLHPTSTGINSSPYSDRRNLWYTFTVNYPGTVRVRARYKKATTYATADFAVYKSDENGSTLFATLVSTGKVDSTLAQGLTHMGNNIYSYNCSQLTDIVSFYNEPCAFVPTRYYVLVDNHYDAQVNSQVEVEVMLDSINSIPPKFDHFSQANDLGLVNSGIKKGAVDNYTCATRDLPDPLYVYTTCQKTLWYKFTTTVTGQIRYAEFFKNINNYYFDHIQLFQQIKPNDSSSTGLQYLPYTSVTTGTSTGAWAQRCISPGTYYILLPGCNAVNEDVYPQIEIIPQDGDFCSSPLVATLKGAGSSIIPVTIDCHTIGTDYGEFNPTLTCPALAATSKYKTSWYRLDITGKDTLDVTVFINEQTVATSSEIKYRMMTGNCGAMQEQSCVQDALTRNTYKCLAPGNSYYIQVFTPVTSAAGQVVTGYIELNTSAVVHADECLPGTNCIAVANFTPTFDCTTDKTATFTNFSTYGTNISYKWDLGLNGQTSTDVSPRFYYPPLIKDSTYTINLEVTNTACGKKDQIVHTITIPARPAANLGNDTVFCAAGSSITYDATSFTGSTYRWSNGTTQPKATFTTTGAYWVEVTYKNCKAKDTVNVWINPIAKQATQTQALCNGNLVTFTDSRGRGELYTWSTGAVINTITVSQPGIYWCDLYLNGCTVRDSFLVISTDARPLGNDTTICQASLPFIANATVSGATAYKWQNNTTNAKFTMTQAGLYWVDITLGGCTFRDSLRLAVDSFKTATINATICAGDNYQMVSGRKINTAGTYYDSIKNTRGCDSIITTIKLTVNAVKKNGLSISICSGQTYKLPSGQIINTAGIYNDTVRYANGCDSLVTTVDLKIGSPVVRDTSIARCQGQTYTLPSGTIARNTGFYQDTIKGKLGCDSLITRLTFTVDSASKVAVNASACSGFAYLLPAGKLVFITGIYKDTLKNIRGCDSLITTTTLTVVQPTRTSATAHICLGQNYTLPSGKKITIGGAYSDTLKSAKGCDSLILSLTLIVDAPQNKVAQASICAGQTFTLPSGKIVSLAGNYLDTIHNTKGCDSIYYSINLLIGSPVMVDTMITRCQGQTYTLPSGAIAKTAGVYRDTVKGKLGCDSLIMRVSFVVDTTVKVAVNANICSGLGYTLPAGRSVLIAGIYRDTLKNIRGCDSLITTTTLTVVQPARTSATVHICLGQNYTMPSGKLVIIGGTYSDTLRTAKGCDSLITSINVIIDSPQNKVAQASICAGQTFTLPSGRVVSLAGNYLDTIHNARGCDSIYFSINLLIGSPVMVDTTIVRCQGQTYTLPSGIIAKTAGIYKDTVKGKLGCDSLIMQVSFVVDTIVKIAVNANICSGLAYTLPVGRLVYNAGVYKDTLKNIRGCDSLITTTTLAVVQPIKSSVVAHICLGQNYILPSGRAVDSAAIYSDTLRHSSGCDSIIYSVDVRLFSAVQKSIAASICAGQNYSLPSGKIVNTAGIYTDTLRYAAGCDSLLFTVNLLIGSPVVNDTTITRCQGQSYTLPSGFIARNIGYYQDTVKGKLGCDSLVTNLHLKWDTMANITVHASACSGPGYKLPGGKTVYFSGTYTDTLRSIMGCDSLATTTVLSITQPLKDAFVAHICLGQYYTLPSGKTINTAGIYNDTLRSVIGCDSLVNTVTLTIDSPETRTLQTSICAGQAYTLPSGKVVSQLGNYLDTVKNVRGCDSLLYSISLQVGSPVVHDAIASQCQGLSYILPSGTHVKATGYYLDTVKSVFGCDSLITRLTLMVDTLKKVAKNATICSGFGYTLSSGKTVYAMGIYMDTLKTTKGCDSLETTTTLIVIQPLRSTIAVQICAGQNYTLPSGRVVNSAAIYSDTLRHINGCDSVIFSVDVKLFSPVLKTLAAFICPAQNYTLPSGKIVNTTGTYLDTLKYSGGCDSILYTVVLKVNNPQTKSIAASICQGQNYTLPSGRLVTVSGNYNDTLRYAIGCDSIIYTIVLTANQPVHTTTNASICIGQSYTLPSGKIVSLAGIYIDTIPSLLTGCDSIISTQLQIRPPLTMSVTGPTKICAGANAVLTATASGGNGGPYTFHWSGAAATGNQITVSPSTNTMFNVSVTDNCTKDAAADSIFITVSQPFVMKVSPDTSICMGSSISLLASGATRYQWLGAGLSQNNSSNPIAKPTVTTTYTVVGFGNDQCFTDTAKITVTIIPLPIVAAGRDTTVMVGVSFSLSPNYSQDVSKYYWSPPDYLSCTNCATPTVTPLKGTLYTITVANSHGCSTSGTKQVNLLCSNDGVFIPNTFTPNGDGVNDVFYPRGRGIRTVRYIRIYNRWGEIIFERTNFNTDDRSSGWDGTYKGQKLSSDVFVYNAEVVCDNGQAVDIKGTVMLIR